VQITWEENYAKFRRRVLEHFNVDLVADADKALQPDVTAFILFEGMINGEFTGKKLADYFNAKTNDPYTARRIVNGLDKASVIANYYKMFYADLSAAREA